MQQILKHALKISRILTRVSQEGSEFSEQLDLALYSAIKIQKIAKKQISHDPISPKEPQTTSTDPFFESAMANIDSFRHTVHALDSKINVLVNQSNNQRHHSHHRRNEVISRSVRQKEVKKSKKEFREERQRTRVVREEKEERNQESREDSLESKSLTQIDRSIIKLTKEIAKVQNLPHGLSIPQFKQLQQSSGP